uniref:BHLH domain-containing protein n=1 Tax=Oryza punctata TaxID=4537 RepID=A0A0E0K5G2_ORYPU
MALEAVVFPQEHLSCAAAMYATPPSLGCGVDMDEFEENGGVVLQEEAGAAVHGGGGDAGGMMSVWVNAATCARSIAASGAVEEFWDERQYPVSSPPAPSRTGASPVPTPAASGGGGGHVKAAARRRRRRPKLVKNKEEAESQRRNHIAVERNRRRQMNEYLAVLRSLMPPSYAQRGDQASIVAGAINFVKELEQLLQSLEAQKRRAEHAPPAPPFAGFFTFPQYSTTVGDNAAGSGAADGEGGCGARPGAADVEVAIAESHANVRVLAPRRPRQLLRMVVALQCLGLTVLHLNVTTTADHLALYSFSLKMEDECRLSSVDEIAAAVNQMVANIAGECIS